MTGFNIFVARRLAIEFQDLHITPLGAAELAPLQTVVINSPFFGSGSRPSIMKTQARDELFLLIQCFSITLYSHLLIRITWTPGFASVAEYEKSDDKKEGPQGRHSGDDRNPFTERNLDSGFRQSDEKKEQPPCRHSSATARRPTGMCKCHGRQGCRE